MLGISYTWGDPDHDKGNDNLQKLIDVLPPVKVNTVATKSCVEHQQQVQIPCLPWGGQRSIYVKTMTPKIIGMLLDAMPNMPASVNISCSMDIVIDHNTCPPNCFGASSHMLLTFADTVSEEGLLEEASAWSDKLYASLRGSGDSALLEGSYPPLTRPDDRTAAQLFGDKWARVRELKRKYDPANVFKNVAPNIVL